MPVTRKTSGTQHAPGLRCVDLPPQTDEPSSPVARSMTVGGVPGVWRREARGRAESILSGPWDQYCGSPPIPAELLARWNVDPALIGIMVAAGAGHFLLLRRSGEWPQKRWWLATTWLLLAFLFVSPLCALSSALFSVRIAHHVILIAVVAPLAAMALPSRWNDVLLSAGWLNALVVIHAVIVWLWHAPSLYALALSHHAIFWVMQLSLLATALLLWLAVLGTRMSPLSSITALLATMMQMGLLGAIITFAPRPLYAPHFGTSDSFGLAALEDQQIGGMIMWVPAVLPYLAAAMVLLTRHIVRSPSASNLR